MRSDLTRGRRGSRPPPRRRSAIRLHPQMRARVKRLARREQRRRGRQRIGAAVEERPPRTAPGPPHRLGGRYGKRDDPTRGQHQGQVLLPTGRAAAGGDHRPQTGRRRPHRLGLAPPKALFPFAREISGTVRPADRTIRSRDRRTTSPDAPPAARPTVVFPEPMKPIKKMGASGPGGGPRQAA